MNIPGYMGKILFIDLKKGSTEVKSLDEGWIRKYLGGWGINYRLAYDLIKPGIDPFSPENPIILGVGPLVGTLYPGANKLMATCKMPMTGSNDGKHFIATSVSGTNPFGLMFKNSGYDHIVILGQADKPVYLKILDDEVQICDAEDLWGKKDLYETTNILNKRHEGFGKIIIGKAGENKVRFAMAFVDKSWHAGKSGFGAVMGSKKLKGIVIKGSRGVNVANPDRFMEVVKGVRERVESNQSAKDIRKIGFHASWDLIWVHNNYQSEKWSKNEWGKYYGIPPFLSVLERVKACSTCAIGCKAEHLVKKGKYTGQTLEATHYTMAAVVGAKLDLEDHGESLKLLNVCNKYGIDGFNATAMIDWITRLYEGGALTKEQADGIELPRRIETYISLVDKIANREGIGNVMADGWFALSKFLDKDASKEYHQSHGIAKGAESIYPARAAKLDPMRITMLMTNPRGGHSPQGHSATAAPLRPLKAVKRDAANTGMSEEDFKKTFSEDDFDHARLTRHIEDAHGVYNALSVCTVYTTMGLTNVRVLSEAYSALTGIQTTPEDLKRKGERIMNLYKLLNVREGFSREHDRPPAGVLTALKTPEGDQNLTDYYRKKNYSMEDCEKLLDNYYQDRGWDIKTGIPTKEKLKDLDLEEFSDILELKRG